MTCYHDCSQCGGVIVDGECECEGVDYVVSEQLDRAKQAIHGLVVCGACGGCVLPEGA